MQDGIYASNTQLGGDVFTASKMGHQLMLQNIQPCANSDYPWSLIGPISTGVSTLGIVMAVAVHPTNSQIIYAGTQASGLWRTSNGRDSWNNVTDVLNLPALGISWIEFDPENSNTVYFATGAHGHSRMIGYGAGIFKISNNGTPTNIIDFSNPAIYSKDFFVSKFLFHPDNSNVMFAISTSNFYKLTKNTSDVWEITYEKSATSPSNQLLFGPIGSYGSYFMDLEVQKIENELQIYVSSFRHHTGRPSDKSGSIELTYTVQNNTSYVFAINGFDLQSGLPRTLNISITSSSNASKESIFNQISNVVNADADFSVKAEVVIDLPASINYNLLKSKSGFPIFSITGSIASVNSSDAYGPIAITSNVNGSNNCAKCEHGEYQTMMAKAWHISEQNLSQWNPIFLNLPSYNLSRYISLEVSKNDPGVLYCMVNKTTSAGNSSYAQIYKSTNNGQTFSLIKNLLVGVYNFVPSGNHDLIVSDIDKNIAFVGENVLHRSTNFQTGADFTEISSYFPTISEKTHADIRSIAEFHGNGQNGVHKLIIGHDGGISLSDLGTNSNWYNLITKTNWANINGNLELSQLFGFDLQPENGRPFIGLQDNGNQKQNVENNWTQMSFCDGGAIEISKTDPNIAYGQCNENFLRFGHNTNLRSIKPVHSQNMPMKLDPIDDRLLWCAQNKLFKFNPITNSFTEYPPSGGFLADPAPQEIRTFDISKSNPNIIFVGIEDPTWGDSYSKKLYKSINGGISFVDVTSNVLINNEEVFNYYSITTVLINPHNSNIIYLAFNGYRAIPSDENQGKFRVLKSTDGGDTWNDMSTGLSQFPVTCLVFQEGTEEVLYAGTDLGIYRWNKQLQKWECYSNGLPKVIITNLEIDYCQNKLTCGTWGRGVWKADLKPVEDVFEITQSQTWEVNSYHGFNTNVSVKSGATLTIKGKVAFAKDNWLQIEPGAKVIIDGGKLFNNCNENWEGIHIAGDPNKTQYPNTNQGYLYIKDAEITNADVAVSTAALNTNGTINWSKTGGGIVVAVNTTFRNNKRHVEFMEYKKTNNYAASFTNCVFELNQVCHAPIPTVDCLKNMTMVTAWGVHGVKFNSCEFRNLNGAENADQAHYNRGIGIYTLDASILVSASINPITCLPQNRGLFSNLSKGIESAHSPSFTLSGLTNIKHQDFELNDKGIVVENGVTYNIYKNNFNLDVPSNYYNRFASPTDVTLQTTGIAGIHSIGTSGFLIEQNAFNFSDLTEPDEIIISTVIDNSQTNGGGGRYRLNQINGTLIGVQTQENNLALQLTCNQFVGSLSALNLNPLSTTLPTPSFGICDPRNTDEGQKNRTDYYNTFMNNILKDAEHFPNNIKTYVIEPGATDRPDPSRVTRVDVNECILQGDVEPKEPCNPTKALNEQCHAEFEQPNPNKGSYISFKTRRDGIADSLNNDLFNPQDLALAQSDYKYYNIETTLARNKVIWSYNVLATLDSNINYTDSIILFLVNETDVVSRKQLIAAYYANSDYSNASQYLINLPEGTAEIEQFKNYYNLLIAISGVGRNIYQLTSEEISTLQSIAATQTSAALAAQGILTLVNGDVFAHTIERIDEEQLLASTNNNLTHSDKWNEKKFKVYPNPANQSVMVSFDLESEEINEVICIQMIDITGKHLFTEKVKGVKGLIEMATEAYNDGIYFIQLRSGGNIKYSRKLIINH